MPNSKTKGDYAELVAAAYFAKQNYVVLRPLSDNASYDLVVDIDGKFQRVQVKGRNKRKDGTYFVELYCNARSYTKQYTSSDFELLAIVDIDTGECKVVEPFTDVKEGVKYPSVTVKMESF